MTDIHLEIERLVVDEELGLPAEQLADAIHAHLARMLADGGFVTQGDVRIDSVTLTVPRPSGRDPVDQAGGSVARRLAARAGGRR